MRQISLDHPFATTALNMAAGLLIAFAFAGSELSTWFIERPRQLVTLLGFGLLVALVVAEGMARLPLQAHRFSPLQRLATNASFGALLGLVGAISGFVAASISLWGLAIWFSVGAAVMSIYYRVCPKGDIQNG